MDSKYLELLHLFFTEANFRGGEMELRIFLALAQRSRVKQFSGTKSRAENGHINILYIYIVI